MTIIKTRIVDYNPDLYYWRVMIKLLRMEGYNLSRIANLTGLSRVWLHRLNKGTRPIKTKNIQILLNFVATKVEPDKFRLCIRYRDRQRFIDSTNELLWTD